MAFSYFIILSVAQYNDSIPSNPPPPNPQLTSSDVKKTLFECFFFFEGQVFYAKKTCFFRKKHKCFFFRIASLLTSCPQGMSLWYEPSRRVHHILAPVSVIPSINEVACLTFATETLGKKLKCDEKTFDWDYRIIMEHTDKCSIMFLQLGIGST